MLQLKQITKDYVVADAKVHALKGVDIAFRRNEFVSVLGPSGCGKTTLLNIIGGLDHYTSGELFINGVSTVNYGVGVIHFRRRQGGTRSPRSRSFGQGRTSRSV